MILKFELTKQEADTLVDSLGKEPYYNVVDLINKLNEQASQQLQDIEK